MATGSTKNGALPNIQRPASSAGKQIGRGTWNDALIQIFYWIFEVVHLILWCKEWR